MKPRTLLIIVLLTLSVVLLQSGTRRVRAVGPNPTSLSLAGECCTLGDPVGWVTNETDLSSAVSPTLNEFVGTPLNFVIVAGDAQHDFAIYTNGTLPSSVNTGNTCNASNTNGCLAHSSIVSYPGQTIFSFTPLASGLPANFGGIGGYEYFCQIHPTLMHGHIKLFKSPDVEPSDHRVDIVDIATIALAYGSSALPTPTPSWNPTVDLDNNGRIDILDVAKAAFYYNVPF